jgi:hypothetical protein
LYPVGEELGVSAAMLKILRRGFILASTSILRVRGSLTSCSNDNEDAGCDRSRGRGASIDTFSVNGPLQGAFAASGLRGLNISLNNKLLKHSSSLQDSSLNCNFHNGSLPLLM